MTLTPRYNMLQEMGKELLAITPEQANKIDHDLLVFVSRIAIPLIRNMQDDPLNSTIFVEGLRRFAERLELTNSKESQKQKGTSSEYKILDEFWSYGQLVDKLIALFAEGVINPDQQVYIGVDGDAAPTLIVQELQTGDTILDESRLRFYRQKQPKEAGEQADDDNQRTTLRTGTRHGSGAGVH